jgi:phospholipid/cholesterol/gamma-HCH transport system ATP-binding protein
VSAAAQHPRPAPAQVDVRELELSFGARRVFRGVSCRFPEGKVSTIVGPSGVGKSTLLRCIAGLQLPDAGGVWVGDLDLVRLPDREKRRFRRRMGMLFQHGALLDSMSVFDNVALPLREHTRLGEPEIADLVHGQFEAVELDGVSGLLPGQLSGGMKKRAALARAMILEPEILLADEPFSGLDPLAIRTIEELLLDLNKRTGVTMILTNHDMGSTMRMSDQVCFLVDGFAIAGTTHEMRRAEDDRIRAFLCAAESGSLLESEPAALEGTR